MDFIDSNVWLYAFIESGESHRRQRAVRLIQSENIAVTTQVINEVCVNLIRKAGLEESAVPGLIDCFYRRCSVIPLNRNLMTDASRLRRNRGFSFWDGLIVAGALRAGCDRLFSEDMHDGFVVDDKLRIENPF